MSVTNEADRADISTFEKFESEVRLYSRKFPVVFTHGRGSRMVDESGRDYLDFFCGAGTLNYGHNPEPAKRRLIEYLANDGILHSLDMFTAVKREFIERLQSTILAPRNLSYRVQFTGPTGTDAVEAALKLARRVTGRRTVVSFTGGFHGMSMGSLGVTGSLRARAAAGMPAQDVVFVPYEDGPAGAFGSVGYLRRLTEDPSGGTGLPAAVIVESVQVDGGIYTASAEWLKALRRFTAERQIVLIVDDIQAGCGRTGDFFSFSHAGIVPDMVTLSKAIGGCGLPLSVVLIDAAIDAWQPGEHTGTFRGNQLALLAGATMLEEWRNPAFLTALASRSQILQAFGCDLSAVEPAIVCRGRGMLLGIDLRLAGGAQRGEQVQRSSFEAGLIFELCGRDDAVIKLMPPLTVSEEDLLEGLATVRAVLQGTGHDGSYA